jgi:hypothetical protein
MKTLPSAPNDTTAQRSMNSGDVFTTDADGLIDVTSPRLMKLQPGDLLDLEVSAVRKRIQQGELRMLAYNGSIPGGRDDVQFCRFVRSRSRADDGRPEADSNRGPRVGCPYLRVR